MEPDAKAIELDIEDYENFMALLAEGLGRLDMHGLPEVLKDTVSRYPAPPWVDTGDPSRTDRLRHMIANLEEAVIRARQRA